MVDTVGTPIKIVILGRIYSIGFTTLCSLSQLNIMNAFSTTEYLGGPICAVGHKNSYFLNVHPCLQLVNNHGHAIVE
jgi:hypothetical protein